MEILVFEDSQENISVAKQAAEGYKQHNFVFVSKAREAMAKLQSGDVNGLVTDFFAPIEPEMENEWAKYLNPFRVYLKYISYDDHKGDAGYLNDWLKDRSVWLRVIEDIDDPDFYFYVLHYKVEEVSNILGEIMRNGDPYLKEFHGYGGALMLEAQKQNIPSVLLTDMHRHGTETNPMNGMLLLTPLVDAGITTHGEIQSVKGPHILLSSGRDGKSKTDPKRWEEAIDLLLSQAK